jgi:hypothetical protein
VNSCTSTIDAGVLHPDFVTGCLSALMSIGEQCLASCTLLVRGVCALGSREIRDLAQLEPVRAW